MDEVLIEGLEVTTTIGVYDWEHNIKQKLILDLEMSWDNFLAGVSDNVTYCLDYAEVSKRVINFIEEGHFQLIERVAEDVAALLIKEFNVPKIKIKVSKPGAVAAARNVAVIVVRQK